MLRRFNFTGRIKIPKSNVKITLIEENDVIKSFNALIQLSDLNLPEGAIVFVEAYYRMMESQRYDYGLVNQIRQPPNSSLGLLGLTGSLKFRVFVVDENGKILALVEDIGVKRESDKTSLLPVDVHDLGSRLWDLAETGDEGAPVLELNSRIEGIKLVAANDPRFILSVYPSVLRQILMRMAFIDCIDFGDPVFTWQKNWIQYSKNIYSTPPEGSIETVKEQIIDWIDGVVKAFTTTRSADWRDYRLLEWPQ